MKQTTTDNDLSILNNSSNNIIGKDENNSDIKDIFKEIQKLSDDGKYDELKKTIDDLVKTRGESEGVKDFFKNTDIGRSYVEGNIGKDYLGNEFKRINILSDDGKYDEVKTAIDDLIKTRGESEGVKDFLKNTDIGRSYVEGNIGKDYLENELKEINILSDDGKYDELKKAIDELIKTRGESEGVKDFLKNTDVGRIYIEGNIGKDNLENELK
ncbi:MAG: hypothetical protein WC850_02905 [Candidatus Gracilibacteria bacterium]